MLSPNEKAFLEGKLNPTTNYKYVLIHKIKKKREKIQQELKLIQSEMKLIDTFLEKRYGPTSPNKD